MSPTTADRYAAIERLYSLGQWQQVLDESEALLAGLTGNDASSLRQRLLLLQGHTRLHGLGQVDTAAALYQQVLDSQPEAVLEAVARQELARARSREQAMDQAFPFKAEAVGTPPTGQGAAAAPWLETLSKTEPEPESQPVLAAQPPWVEQQPAPEPLTPVELVEEPEQIVVHQADPTRAEIVDLAPWSPAEEAELARGLLEVVLR
jgi:hypothetical protein